MATEWLTLYLVTFSVLIGVGGALCLQLPHIGRLGRQVCIISILLGVVLFGAGSGRLYYVATQWEKRMQKPFSALIDSTSATMDSEDRSLANLPVSRSKVKGWSGTYVSDPATGQIYLRRKVFIVDKAPLNRETTNFGGVETPAHALRGKLPRDLLASTPAEVGTIITLETWDHEITRYVNGSAAMCREFRLVFVDVDKNSIVARVRFFGEGEPPTSILEKEQWVTKPDLEGLAEYIRALKQN
jgi:hypothetical protein